ncbi:MAG: DUF4339 domain-containing protein [Verrucomicrobiaceae bacterium]|nr:DUF4339 domain-containing protein [Verrucomicrobiaceae bacterium]
MMQIYLVIDEEKKGPFTLFQVEEQLRDGTWSDDQLAWYDGEGEWKALRELPPFETFFRRRDVELEDERRLKVAERHAEVQRERAETLPRINVRPWTRFWARNLDWWFFFVFCLVLMLGMRAIGWIDTSMEGFMTVFPMLMPVMHLIEAYCLDRWGATPGKALVGIRVVDAEGNTLDFGAALRRYLGVFVMGMGCYVGPLTLITMPAAYYLLVKNRQSFWDVSTGSFVQHETFRARHIAWPFAIVFGMMLLFQKPFEEVAAFNSKRMETLREAINGEQVEES